MKVRRARRRRNIFNGQTAKERKREMLLFGNAYESRYSLHRREKIAKVTWRIKDMAQLFSNYPSELSISLRASCTLTLFPS